MFGDSFFTGAFPMCSQCSPIMFSSPCLGILFSLGGSLCTDDDKPTLFSSPCLGILFSQLVNKSKQGTRNPVFVPMFGDSFFTFTMYGDDGDVVKRVFVPMFGDSFFTADPGCPTGWALYGPFAAGISN